MDVLQGFGVLITLAINFLLIPKYGYVASAYATLSCYSSMMILSYLIGQKNYKVPYNLKKFFLYIGSGILIYMISIPIDPTQNLTILQYGYHTILLLSFIILVLINEKPFSNSRLNKENGKYNY